MVITRRLPHGSCCYPGEINHALCHKWDYIQQIQINDLYRRLIALESKTDTSDKHPICEQCNLISARVTELESIVKSLKDEAIETVTLSITPPTAGAPVPARSGNNDCSNTVAFDALLADVAEYEEKDLNDFYNEYISPVVAVKDYNLLAPIPATAFKDCTRIPSENKAMKWVDIKGNTEKKRAYIMQFILANRSNQTRAVYLTNQLTGSLTLPIRDGA